MAKLRDYLKYHSFEGRRKYFWISSTIFKTVCLLLRTVVVVKCLNRPRRVADLTASFPVALMGLLKLFHLYFDKPRVDYLYNTITFEFWDYRVCGPEIEKQAMRVFTFTNRMMSFHFVTSCVCLVLIISFPIAEMPSENDRMLPNIIWTPFDLNSSPVYEIAFALLLVNCGLSFMGNVFYDFFYVYCVQHLYVQFILLKGMFMNITENIMDGSSDVDKFNSPYFQKTIMDRLRICAEHHSRLLKYGKSIETYCSKVLVPQLVMTYASLVVTGFILCSERSMKTTVLFNLSLSTLIQLIFFALLSSELYEQSLSLIDAVYDSKWYLFNASMKRACTYIIMNAKEGIVIKAGGSTRIDNPLVVDMIQKVFSAITLLRALVEGNSTD